ncbi:GNAT family N-acetyltransferase [Gloeobacter kilaueensis]|uniref:Aminoglycoside N(6')-acetyltransferase type 1 n=1 Tax=Gloeobacter kilaueensis (strain ATCC BAA-2537 / CCAP 1431/1 / ULC 316 / JS1) TaxID=1183438 RepID=U5QHX1_GLOK1|nr:GNAT family N-acetyltransferase [Gloeobacter kilaueensis]AGY57260.1 GCN5-related N-acetyltransferase [Gloeobacter kilaueensis JS1]
MRSELWPEEVGGEHAREIERYFAGGIEPWAMTVLVYPRSNGGLAGFVELSVRASAPGCESANVGYLEGWYVDADVRNRGMGRALVAAAEAWARAQGCSEMASDAEIENLVSLRAHERLGYQEVERTVHFCKRLIAQEGD